MICRRETWEGFALTNLNKLIWLVEIGHLSGAQDVVDVFQEGLVYNLGVVEQEHRGLVVHAGQAIQLLDVCRQDGSVGCGRPDAGIPGAERDTAALIPPSRNSCLR